MQWYELITRHPIGPPADVPSVGSQPMAATREILVQTAVMATQIAAELLTCTNMEDVHQLARQLRVVGRRSVIALNEEHRIAEGGATCRPDRAEPSTSTGVGPDPGSSTSGPPSVSLGDGPSTFAGVGPPSCTSAPTDRPSIDNYTVITDDAEALRWKDQELVTPNLRRNQPFPPSQMQPVRRRMTRTRYQPLMGTSQVHLEESLSQAQAAYVVDPPSQSHVTEVEEHLNQAQATDVEEPHSQGHVTAVEEAHSQAQGGEPVSQQTAHRTRPQLVETRRNPKRTRKIPSCGTH